MPKANPELHNGIKSNEHLLFRKPRRITVTVPDQIYRILMDRSSREGRSISNLAAYLLECAVANQQGQVEPEMRIAADQKLIP